MSLKPVGGIPQASSPTPLSAPTSWGPVAQRRAVPAVPSSRTGGGTRHDLWIREPTLPVPHLSRPKLAAALPAEERGPSSCTLTTGVHPDPGPRLPPATWGQCTCGREKPGTRRYNLPSTLKPAHFWLHKLEPVSELLWASVSYSIKGTIRCLPSRADGRFRRHYA